MRRIFRRTRAALLALHILTVGAVAAPVPALAMQILDAADHGELAAEISATNVNRIALAGDRIAKVVRSPDGYAVEHDAASGDIYLRPAGAQPGTPAAEAAPDRGEPAPAPGSRPGQAFEPGRRAGFEPVTLFIGTEKGFTYRLTLMPSARASAQILIRNADAVPAAASVPASGGEPRIGVRGEPHVGALVRLVRAVARREPLPGYAIHAGGGSLAAGIRLVETWRGPRFAALVLEADALPSAPVGGAAGLAGTIGSLPGIGPVAALWLAPPATGPSGGRLGVAVVEAAATGDLR